MRKILFATAAALLMGTFAANAQNAPAAAPSAQTAPDKAKKEPTAGQTAARERMKKCGAEWKDAKAAGKVEKGMTWSKYWSDCNKRLKSSST
jgi:hypothetical protein